MLRDDAWKEGIKITGDQNLMSTYRTLEVAGRVGPVLSELG